MKLKQNKRRMKIKEFNGKRNKKDSKTKRHFFFTIFHVLFFFFFFFVSFFIYKMGKRSVVSKKTSALQFCVALDITTISALFVVLMLNSMRFFSGFLLFYSFFFFYFFLSFVFFFIFFFWWMLQQQLESDGFVKFCDVVANSGIESNLFLYCFTNLHCNI